MPSRSGPQREPRSPAPPPRGVLDGGAWGVGRIPGMQIAGPTISLALARLFQIGRDSLQVDTAAGETLATMTTWLARINWSLAVFNCVPGTSWTRRPDCTGWFTPRELAAVPATDRPRVRIDQVMVPIE